MGGLEAAKHTWCRIEGTLPGPGLYTHTYTHSEVSTCGKIAITALIKGTENTACKRDSLLPILRGMSGRDLSDEWFIFRLESGSRADGESAPMNGERASQLYVGSFTRESNLAMYVFTHAHTHKTNLYRKTCRCFKRRRCFRRGKREYAWHTFTRTHQITWRPPLPHRFRPAASSGSSPYRGGAVLGVPVTPRAMSAGV